MTLRLADTRVASPSLVPELKLHLLTSESPHFHAADPDALGWPYWAVAWPGGQALARFLLDEPHHVRGKRVLDFGSGGGVVGLAAAKAGAAHVLCADVDPRAAEAAHANATLNGGVVSATAWTSAFARGDESSRDPCSPCVPGLASCATVLETTTADLIGAPRGSWDVVVAGDVCFEPAFAARVLAWLRALAAEGCDVLLGDPRRVTLPEDGLEVLASFEAPHDGDPRALTRWPTLVARVHP
ncbi:MAG: 50S ribosomal protein L11 methyltransferase [Myxococcota bacterium]